MNDILIYGAGGFGREVALLIEQINEEKPRWNMIGFVDDGKVTGMVVDGVEVLGGMDVAKKLNGKTSMVIAVAEPAIRKRIVEQLAIASRVFPTLVHPWAQMGSKSRNTIGYGSIIASGTILTTGINIGNFSIINLACTIGHDVSIGEFCTLMPGCNISGNVEIGEVSMIGTGSQVLQNLAIGSHCKVGAGAVVTKSFDDGLTLLGVPAQPRARHA